MLDEIIFLVSITIFQALNLRIVRGWLNSRNNNNQGLVVRVGTVRVEFFLIVQRQDLFEISAPTFYTSSENILLSTMQKCGVVLIKLNIILLWATIKDELNLLRVCRNARRVPILGTLTVICGSCSAGLHCCSIRFAAVSLTHQRR